MCLNYTQHLIKCREVTFIHIRQRPIGRHKVGYTQHLLKHISIQRHFLNVTINL